MARSDAGALAAAAVTRRGRRWVPARVGVPYLEPLEIWPLPLTGAAYARLRCTWRGPARGLRTSSRCSRGGRAWPRPRSVVGLAQESWLWVAVGEPGRRGRARRRLDLPGDPARRRSRARARDGSCCALRCALVRGGGPHRSPSTRPRSAGVGAWATRSPSRPGPGVYRPWNPGSSRRIWPPGLVAGRCRVTLCCRRPGRRALARGPAGRRAAGGGRCLGRRRPGLTRRPSPTPTLAGRCGRTPGSCWPRTSRVWFAVNPAAPTWPTCCWPPGSEATRRDCGNWWRARSGTLRPRCTGGTATPRRTSTSSGASGGRWPASCPQAHVLEVESERRPIARVVTERALVRDPASSSRWRRRCGSPARTGGSRRSWPRAWCRCGSRGRGSCRPRTRRGEGSSGTCTTAPSSC